VYASLGIDQVFLTHHNIRLDFLYNGIKVIDDKDRFTSKDRGFVNPAEFNYNHFAGTQLSYSFSKTNNKIIPTKGINFKITSSYTKNLSQQKHSVFKTGTSLNIYLPLIKDFSIAIKSGASTLTGDPETYQYNTLGGYYTLRGFWRYRFYGRSVFYDQNELRWLPEVKGYWFTGKMGLVAFYDQGRVWQPGENSTKWHHGYGGGIILSPFNKIAIAVTYGISEETTRTNIRLGKFL
jgi:hemolysin activation/secretion protein